MVRFVLAPDGALAPDVVGTLPGRGVWVTASRSAMETAVKKQVFSRGFKQPVRVTPELVTQVEQLLRVRLLHWLALANKSGEAVMGFSKVEVALKEHPLELVLLASDAGPSDADKIQGLAGRKGVNFCNFLTRAELGRPFGREEAVHVAVKPGGIAGQMQKEIRRLAGFSAKGTL